MEFVRLECYPKTKNKKIELKNTKIIIFINVSNK